MKKSFLSDARLFYAHAALFAFSEIIFILSLPVYLYTQGFSLSFIFLFHGILGMTVYLFTSHVISRTLKVNIKYPLIFGVIFYIAFGLAARSISLQNHWWLVAFFCVSFQSLLYWPVRHLFFVEIAKQKTMGLQTGILNAVSIISRVAAPIAAGAITLLFSFSSVFLFGAGVMMLSILPILFIKKKVKIHFDRKEFLGTRAIHEVFTKTHWSYIADGMNNTLSYLMWPLFFYILLANQDFFQLGSLMTVTLGISAVIMVFVGHLFDKNHRKALLTGSIALQGVGSFLRFLLFFFHPLLFVYGVQSLYAFSESALQSTLDSYFYSYGKATNTAFFIIHREMNFSLGRFILCALLALISFFIKVEHLWFLFLLSFPILFLYYRQMRVDHFVGTKGK